jgi:NhaP-type Na+/H+ or K+/H+ antiporter
LKDRQQDKPWRWRWWAVVVWFAAFGAASLAFLNGIPQFVDGTLPWLGDRISLGPIDVTAWAVVTLGTTIVALSGALVAMIYALAGVVRSERQMKGRDRATRRHTLAAVGGTTVSCSCGWRGPGWEFAKHRSEG